LELLFVLRCFWQRPAIGGFFVALLHLDTHDVVSAVDVNHFAGDPGRHRAAKENGGVSYLASVYVTTERRVFGVMFQHGTEIGNAASRKSLNWTSAVRVDSDVARAEIFGEISSARFEGRLCYAHHVVTRDNFLGAVVGHADDA